MISYYTPLPSLSLIYYLVVNSIFLLFILMERNSYLRIGYPFFPLPVLNLFSLYLLLLSLILYINFLYMIVLSLPLLSLWECLLPFMRQLALNHPPFKMSRLWKLNSSPQYSILFQYLMPLFYLHAIVSSPIFLGLTALLMPVCCRRPPFK